MENPSLQINRVDSSFRFTWDLDRRTNECGFPGCDQEQYRRVLLRVFGTHARVLQ